MSKYKVGDKFIVEIKEVMDSDNGTLYRSNFSTLVFDDYGLDKLQKYEDDVATKTYEDGLNDAWELARKIENKMSLVDLKYLFNSTKIADILDNFTPQEAFAKIEAYEKSKQIDRNEIVELPNRSLGVVTYADVQLDKYTVIDYMGRAKNDYNATQLKKTGRHIDIEHLLEQVRGNE